MQDRHRDPVALQLGCHPQRAHVQKARGDHQRVAGVDDRHPGHGAEEREVLGRLVARVVAGGETGERGDDLHVKAFLRDRLVDEVVGAAGGEDRTGGGEGLKAHMREAGSGAHPELLGHAHG